MIKQIWNRITNKTSMWVKNEDGTMWRCAECGHTTSQITDRCYGCGRKMMGYCTFHKDYIVRMSTPKLAKRG